MNRRTDHIDPDLPEGTRLGMEVAFRRLGAEARRAAEEFDNDIINDQFDRDPADWHMVECEECRRKSRNFCRLILLCAAGWFAAVVAAVTRF